MSDEKSPYKKGHKKAQSNKLKGILAKRPLEINDPEYPLGACIKDGEGNYIGLRLCGLNALTIKHIKTGKDIKLTGRYERRLNGIGKRVRCFIVESLKVII